MSVLSTTLVLGQGGRWEFSMPSPGRVSPICSSQEQAERDRPWRSFTPPLRFPPANWGDFLPWKSHSWNLHPFLPLLLFLACLASSFFLAQPFANLSTDGKVHSKVTWIVWKTSTLHPSVLPQQILVFTLLGSVLLRPWPLQVFCLWPSPTKLVVTTLILRPWPQSRVMIEQFCNYAKTHWFVHFKRWTSFLKTIMKRFNRSFSFQLQFIQHFWSAHSGHALR